MSDYPPTLAAINARLDVLDAQALGRKRLPPELDRALDEALDELLAWEPAEGEEWPE